MEERITIACYKPKSGKAEALRQLMKTHLPTLKEQKLVTERASIMMEAKDGTILEVFEWKSQAAIDQAHSNPAVLKMWEKFGEVCEYIPIGKVEEAADLFSGFTPFI
ncbi:MAG: hypothetical protein HY015_01755 [Bacteroidetes bacterium]|nr:hypothetical protein [Bacteroidota bacterium]MBI3481699.1 hypothetical protein [Bacteroidota bacterium]